MKKNILIFGLIAGLIASSMLIAMTITCYTTNKFEGNMLLGYTFMLIAFSFVFVGVKNYRDQFNGGVISLGKAFKIGAIIALIASTVYVLVWLICYYLFMPDFMERFTANFVEELKAKGTSAVKIKEEMASMDFYKDMYKTPFGVILLTYMEILPVGLVISFVVALILRRNLPKFSANATT
ncbi:DUF4199 domain-containing protein [Pedobacter sp. Du54]|uniref:DUF4199 domain-containing protein n=1 Tax=Pedobacter anseongensis TaxID=3133439 RepID=UPI0030958D8E